MLINEERKKELVTRIIEAAKVLLAHAGATKSDPGTGFVHKECRIGSFVMVEHQRQQLEGGFIKTNGLDIWQIDDGDARKLLSVNYIPFQIKHFYLKGKAPWIDTFLSFVKEESNQEE